MTMTGIEEARVARVAATSKMVRKEDIAIAELDARISIRKSSSEADEGSRASVYSEFFRTTYVKKDRIEKFLELQIDMMNAVISKVGSIC